MFIFMFLLCLKRAKMNPSPDPADPADPVHGLPLGTSPTRAGGQDDVSSQANSLKSAKGWSYRYIPPPSLPSADAGPYVSETSSPTDGCARSGFLTLQASSLLLLPLCGLASSLRRL